MRPDTGHDKTEGGGVAWVGLWGGGGGGVRLQLVHTYRPNKKGHHNPMHRRVCLELSKMLLGRLMFKYWPD